MLAVTMFMSCIVSTAYASTTAVSGTTWKETLAGADVEVPEVYNAEDGTFGESLRVVSHSAGEASRTYMFGVELGEKIESGTLVVDAVFSNVAASAWSIINIFGIANEESGWKTAEKSGLVFDNVSGDTSNVGLLSYDVSGSSTADALYKSRWNTDVSSSYDVSASDGVYELKFVASAESETDDWEIKIYNTDINTESPIYTYTVSRASVPDITYIINSNWMGKGKEYGGNYGTASLTVEKYAVMTFEHDITGVYQYDEGDTDDRTVSIGMSGNDLVDITEAYVIDEEDKLKIRATKRAT